jgi:hypothetical protein
MFPLQAEFRSGMTRVRRTLLLEVTPPPSALVGSRALVRLPPSPRGHVEDQKNLVHLVVGNVVYLIVHVTAPFRLCRLNLHTAACDRVEVWGSKLIIIHYYRSEEGQI